MGGANYEGFPTLAFHGGPGAGFSIKDRRRFDPTRRTVMFDQRSCGRSRPLKSLKNNTTQNLIEDAAAILNKLKIYEAVLEGGSWGSTLALLFAIAHPERTAGICLRGVFLGERGEINYSETGLIAQHFPQAWQRFVSPLDLQDKTNPLAGYYRGLIGNAEKSTSYQKKRLIYEWARFEDAHLSLTIKDDKTFDREYAKEKPETLEAVSTLEIHYLYNNCFIENGFILKNISRIPLHIPISIIHGRYDVICPPRSAYRLYQALQKHNVKLCWTQAGHSKKDPENQSLMLSEMDRIYQEIKHKRAR